MSTNEKARMVRLIIRVSIYLAIAISVFIVLRSVLSVSVITFTFNWVKLYAGLVMLAMSTVIYSMVFCRRGGKHNDK